MQKLNNTEFAMEGSAPKSVRDPASPRIAREKLKYTSPEIDRMAKRVRKIFDSLDRRSFLGNQDRVDFLYFDKFFSECFRKMDDKIRDGRLVPQDMRGFPHISRFPGHKPRVGIFIGSFDPFQMTHLAMALRFLASDKSEADIVYVVPEGNFDPRKPRRTDYRFRYDLLDAQLHGVFEPFVLPFDIGEGADTIGIVNKLIEWHAGSELRLTHIVGSDVLPLVVKYIGIDLDSWRQSCTRCGVCMDFSGFVVRRNLGGSSADLLGAVRKAGVRMTLDRRRIGTPSSTDFRSDRAITIVFPSEAMLARLEILFRYSMHTPWRVKGDPNDPVFRWEI